MGLINSNEQIAKIGMAAYTTNADTTRTFYQKEDDKSFIGYPMQINAGTYAKPFAGGTFVGILYHTPDHVVEDTKKTIKGDRSLMIMQVGNMFIELKDYVIGDEIEGTQAFISATGEFLKTSTTGAFKLNGTYGIDRESKEPILLLNGINAEEVA